MRRPWNVAQMNYGFHMWVLSSFSYSEDKSPAILADTKSHFSSMTSWSFVLIHSLKNSELLWWLLSNSILSFLSALDSHLVLKIKEKKSQKYFYKSYFFTLFFNIPSSSHHLVPLTTLSARTHMKHRLDIFFTKKKMKILRHPLEMIFL